MTSEGELGLWRSPGLLSLRAAGCADRNLSDQTSLKGSEP
jgi:hypothetical protein